LNLIIFIYVLLGPHPSPLLNNIAIV